MIFLKAKNMITEANTPLHSHHSPGHGFSATFSNSIKQPQVTESKKLTEANKTALKQTKGDRAKKKVQF
jgi:hypothetical protein